MAEAQKTYGGGGRDDHKTIGGGIKCREGDNDGGEYDKPREGGCPGKVGFRVGAAAIRIHMAGGGPDPQWGGGGGWGYHGIVLVEVVWKVVVVILNYYIKASINLQDFLHGFREDCGTGTTTLEANLLHQLSIMREEVLYMIFLDLHKAYVALDRDRCLEILEGYGVGPRSHGIL